MPELVDDIRSIVDPKSQADPKFQTPFLYTRMMAKAVLQALIDEKGYTDDELPCENTMGNILKRAGYKLKRIQKTKRPKRSKRFLKRMIFLEVLMQSIVFGTSNETTDLIVDGLELWYDKNRKWKMENGYPNPIFPTP